VGLLAPDDRLEQAGDGQRIGLGQGLVPDPDRPIGALREAFPQALLGLLVADRDDDDLALAAALAQAQRLLEGNVVPLVQRPLQVGRFDVAVVVAELELVAERRNLLDGNYDLHRSSLGRGAMARCRAVSITLRARGSIPPRRYSRLPLT